MRVVPQQSPTGFEGESDSDLLGFMAMKDDSGAKAAGDEFFRRHAKFVNATLARSAIARGWSEELAQDTMLMAYLRAETFQSCAGLTPDQDRRRVRSWLMAIADNLARDAGSDQRSADSFAADLLAWSRAESEAKSGSPHAASRELRLIEKALETLTDRERDVLFTSMEHEKPNAAHQRLPNSVSAELMARLQTTAENIRMIRKRARTKFRASIEERLEHEAKGGKR